MVHIWQAFTFAPFVMKDRFNVQINYDGILQEMLIEIRDLYFFLIRL